MHLRVNLATIVVAATGCGGIAEADGRGERHDAATASSDGGTSVYDVAAEDGTVVCLDDGFEENDSQEQALSQRPLEPGKYPGLRMCPGASGQADDDWYRIEVADKGVVSLTLDGGTQADLDLSLFDRQGTLLDYNASPGSHESIRGCVAAGNYTIHVSAWLGADDYYTLGYSYTPGCPAGCDAPFCATPPPPPLCDDDDEEPDSDASHARRVDLSAASHTDRFVDNVICLGDEDWFRVDLSSGQTLFAFLEFVQDDPARDLDLLLYRGATLLTLCTEQDISGCDPTNGQSDTSNESASWNITHTDVHYVVVRGWDRSENTYGLCISTEPSGCG